MALEPLSHRLRSLLTHVDFGGLLASLGAGAVMVLLFSRGGVPWSRALFVTAPAVLFLGAATRASRHLVRGRAFAPARRVGTLVAVVSASAVTAAIFLAIVQVMRMVVEVDVPVHNEVPLLAMLAVTVYLTGAAFNLMRSADEDAQRARHDALLASLRVSEAELRALHAKVNPHFLFNSLNSIAALTTRDPQGARQMCLDLAHLLRERLSGARDFVPLSEELETVRRYLAIEKVRFAERLGYEQDVPPVLQEVEVPVLVVQPLVENALKHGIARRQEGGVVRVTATAREGRLFLQVHNPLGDEPARGRRGHGLQLVRGRLEVLYGARASLTVHQDEQSFVATLELPLSGHEENP